MTRPRAGRTLLRSVAKRSLLPGMLVGGFVVLAAAQTPGPVPDPAEADVRAFGAKGDGTADDTAAVQAAVESGLGVVRFPKGTYRLTKPVMIPLEKTGFVSLRGDTVGRVVMAGEGPAFRFVGSHTKGSAAPATFDEKVWAKERMPAVDGLEILGAHEKANGIQAVGTMQLTLTRVLIRHCFHGVHLTDRNRNVLIADCHVYKNRGIGIFLDHVNLHQINVSGSHVSYCDRGGIVLLGGQVRNLHVSGCDIESNQGVGSPPTANVLIDSTGGTNAEVAITGCTIQHNHNAAGSCNVRVKGPTTPLDFTPERRDGHVTISGNVLSDTMVNVHLDHARGVVISGNTFWTGYEHNLLVENCAHVVVGPNNFERNPRYRREEKESTANDLIFRDSADCTLTGLHVSGVRAAPAGVTLERCDRFNVGNLTILDCDGVGLLLKDVTRSRVGGCLIRDDREGAKSLALKATGGSGNVIADNVFGRPVEAAAGIGEVTRNFGGK